MSEAFWGIAYGLTLIVTLTTERFLEQLKPGPRRT